MAEPVDIESEIYTQIWVLLLAFPAFETGVPVANRIRYDANTGLHNPEKSNVQDGDFPQASLRLRSGLSNLWNDEITFETYSSGGPHFWKESQQFVYRLELVSDLLDIRDQDVLSTSARKAIRKGGPRMGLTYVEGVRLQWETNVEPDAENKDKVRWRTRMDIIVACRVEEQSS